MRPSFLEPGAWIPPTSLAIALLYDCAPKLRVVLLAGQRFRTGETIGDQRRFSRIHRTTHPDSFLAAVGSTSTEYPPNDGIARPPRSSHRSADATTRMLRGEAQTRFMNTRRAVTIFGIAAFGAATLLGGGIASADQRPSGNGTRDNPFTAPCSFTPTSDHDTCLVRFPTRTLKGLESEHIPAYKCPVDRPWLVNKNLAPFGTTLLRGVAVDGIGPIGVSITDGSRVDSDGSHAFVATATGFPYSSAQNWNTDERSYSVILHCTSNWEMAKRK